MAENTELENSQKSPEEQELDELLANDNPDGAQDDENAKLKELNKQLFARAKKAEGFELVDGHWVKKPKQEPQPIISKSEPIPDDRLARIEFKQDHPEFTKEQLDFIWQYSKGAGITPEKAIQSDFVKKAFEKSPEEKLAEATPATPTRSSPVSPDKPVSKMTREEHMEFAKKKAGQA